MSLDLAVQRPDRVLASGEHAGLPWVVRHNGRGYRCGYVLLPLVHPWIESDDRFDVADVHGGITYTSADTEGEGLWIGFDCNHADDLADASLSGSERNVEFEQGVISLCKDSAVRTQEYVIAECMKLCEQASAAKGA